MNAFLLALVALSLMAPELAAAHLGGTVRAWEVVCNGMLAGALWLVVASYMDRQSAVAVCLYGAFEAWQVPLWRLMLPMDRAPQVPAGQSLGDLVTGWPVSYLSPIALAFVVWFIAKDFTKPVRVYSSNIRNKGP